MKATPSLRRSTLFSLLPALYLALVLPALAEKQKTYDLGGFPLWTAKKNPIAAPFIPGLNAALLLTEEQKTKLIEARSETFGNEELQKLGAAIKKNPNASEGDREAAHKAYDVARGQFKERVDAILTAAQRKLIADINTVFEEVSAATGEAFRDRYAQLKNDKASAGEVSKEAREKNAKDFKTRLEGMLNKDQWTALDQAAAAEEAAAKNSVKVKKN